MPRCLMAKKWKAYPWPDRVDDQEQDCNEDNNYPIQDHTQDHVQIEIHTTNISSNGGESVIVEKRNPRHDEDEEIDVVGDTDMVSRQQQQQLQQHQIDPSHHHHHHHHQHQTCWGPHSPTAGATAPSPPPLNASGALYYHGYTHEAWLNHEEPPKYATLRSAAELARPIAPSPPLPQGISHPQEMTPQVVIVPNNLVGTGTTASTSTVPINLPPRKSLSMCFTSTGTALSLPPKKKDIYRPYSLHPTSEIRTAAEEDLSAAQAILDLSASPAAPTHSVFIHTLSPTPPPPPPPPPPSIPASATTIVITSTSQQQLIQQQQQQQQQQSVPVSVLVPVPVTQTESSRHQEQSQITPHNQPQSPATAETNCTPGNKDNKILFSGANGSTKTVAYTYEAFFVSDGRSKRRGLGMANNGPINANGTNCSGPNNSNGTGNSNSNTNNNNNNNINKNNNNNNNNNNNTTTINNNNSNYPSLNPNSASVPDKEAAQPERPKFTCTECGKQYATSSNLSRHKQTHRSLDSQSAKKCIHCGKAYVSMPALAMHVLTHKLAHSCGVCGKMFSRPWLLQGHLRSHTGEKPYGCAHCGKAFADRSNLRAHMQTHSADKNYECSRCHKTFALKSYLNKHLESACLRDEEMQQQQSPGGTNTQPQQPQIQQQPQQQLQQLPQPLHHQQTTNRGL